jgi:hypothetical protein
MSAELSFSSSYFFGARIRVASYWHARVSDASIGDEETLELEW